MKKVITNIVKNILFLSILALIIVLTISSSGRLRQDVICVNLTNDAELLHNGKVVCIGDVSKYSVSNMQYGDKISIRKQITEREIVNAVVSFNNSINAAYEIRLDGKKITSCGMKATKNSVVCNNWVTIPIGNSIKGKTIEITLRCINGKVFNGIPEMLCMNSKDEIVNYMFSNLEYLIIGQCFIMVGIILLLIMRVNTVFEIYNKKIVYISLASVFSGSWIYACFQVYRVIFYNNIIDFYLEYMSLGLAILFLNLYVYELYDSGIERKILLYTRYALIVSLVAMCILQATNRVYMNDSVILIQIIGLIAIILLMKNYYNMIQKNTNYSIWRVIQKSVCLLILVIITFFIITHRFSGNINMLNFVILAFLICLLQATVTVIKEIKESYILTAEEKSAAHLAYLDTLTRIQNRRGFDRYINELNKKISNEKYAICSFDLDDLKCVNDTYGHSEGDLYIKAFANELKKQVEEDEFCGRMGGDEFLLIVKYDRVKNVLKELCKRIKEKNEKNNLQYKVSYSVGTSVYVNDGQDDIKESLKIADDEMYRIKGSKKNG